MEPKKEETQEQPAEEKLSRDEVVQIVNQAITSHQKRQLGSIEKLIADQFSKFQPAPAKTDEEPKPADGKGGKDDASKRLEQRLADMQRRLDESEAKAKKVESDRRRDLVRSGLKQELKGKGFRDELLDMVVTHWEATGTLKYDDDDRPLITVKRSRSKNSPAEEMSFDDLKAGIEDFSKAPEAAALLKPPSNATAQTRNGDKPQPRVYDKPPVGEDEAVRRMAEIIDSQGGLFKTE